MFEFESLEGRTLLSGGHSVGSFNPYGHGAAQATLNGGTLKINNAHDVQFNTLYSMNADGSQGGVIGVELIDKGVRGNQVTDFLNVNNVVIVGTKDYDIISGNSDGMIGVQLNGGGGNDEITFSNNGNGIATLHGGNGNDSFFVSARYAGTTTVYGDAGKDTFASGLGGSLDPDVTWVQ